MKTKWHSCIAPIACSILTLLASVTTRAATLFVTSTGDTGAGSLRAALKSARSGDTIRFSLPTPATIRLTSGELLVSKNLNIIGPGADSLLLSGNSSSRVFRVSSGMTVSITGLTIASGVAFGRSSAGYGGGIYSDRATLTITDCVMSGNMASGGGGAIYSDHASLTLRNCMVSGNLATNGMGGGIKSDGSLRGSAVLRAVDCTFSNNAASNSGGGVANDGNSSSATATIVGCRFSGNTAYYGGGIATIPGTATTTLLNCTLDNNSAGFSGGGIYSSVAAATLTVSNCTVSGNFARSGGGGVYNSQATALIVNSTVRGNVSAGNGGGIFHQGPSLLTVLNGTLTGNRASIYGGGIFNLNGTLQIGSTILNGGGFDGNIFGSGSVISLGYNLSSDSGFGKLTHSTDLLNTDPMLGPLQDNGGQTYTHLPLPGSPAIDQGYNFCGSDNDQRGSGFFRTVDLSSLPNAAGGDGTDIGAAEAQ